MTPPPEQTELEKAIEQLNIYRNHMMTGPVMLKDVDLVINAATKWSQHLQQKSQESEDKERLDWLEANPISIIGVGCVIQYHSKSLSNLTLRQAIDKARELAKQAGLLP